MHFSMPSVTKKAFGVAAGVGVVAEGVDVQGLASGRNSDLGRAAEVGVDRVSGHLRLSGLLERARPDVEQVVGEVRQLSAVVDEGLGEDLPGRDGVRGGHEVHAHQVGAGREVDGGLLGGKAAAVDQVSLGYLISLSAARRAACCIWAAISPCALPMTRQ